MPRSLPSRRAAGVAASALVLATALTGCSALSGLFGSPAARDSDTREIVEAGNQSAFSMLVGDCFNDTTGEELSEVPAVPCSEPHDNEVYYIFDLDFPAWPGQTEIQNASDAGCIAEFAAFIGKPYEESTIDFYSLMPSQGSWENMNDREVICSVWDPAGLVTGSLKGVAR